MDKIHPELENIPEDKYKTWIWMKYYKICKNRSQRVLIEELNTEIKIELLIIPIINSQ